MESLGQDTIQGLETMNNILPNAVQVVNGVSTSIANSDNWWEQPFSAPSTTTPFNIPNTDLITCSSSLTDVTYKPSYSLWHEDRYLLYTQNNVAPSSHLAFSPPSVSPPCYPHRPISPPQEFDITVSPQQGFPMTSPPPYPTENSYVNMPGTIQNYYPNSAPSEHSTMDSNSAPSSPENIDFFTDHSRSVTMSPQILNLSPPLLIRTTKSCQINHPPRTVVSGNKNKSPSTQMPIRKGGIQLWQFLYGLLSNSTHRNIIEWTSNRASNEFRMLEPESIAVWWGTIKSKPTMTYDKFSRSLRYYYHKGILRKIQGERYMYRFLVDPEDMYRHIGSSDKRPELKNMPKEAKMVMGIFQKQNIDTDIKRAPIVTKPPERQEPKIDTELKSLKVESFGLDFNNSNNTCMDSSELEFSVQQSLPILIPTAVW